MYSQEPCFPDVQGLSAEQKYKLHLKRAERAAQREADAKRREREPAEAKKRHEEGEPNALFF